MQYRTSNLMQDRVLTTTLNWGCGCDAKTATRDQHNFNRQSSFPLPTQPCVTDTRDYLTSITFSNNWAFLLFVWPQFSERCYAVGSFIFPWLSTHKIVSKGIRKRACFLCRLNLCSICHGFSFSKPGNCHQIRQKIPNNQWHLEGKLACKFCIDAKLFF